MTSRVTYAACTGRMTKVQHISPAVLEVRNLQPEAGKPPSRSISSARVGAQGSTTRVPRTSCVAPSESSSAAAATSPAIWAPLAPVLSVEKPPSATALTSACTQPSFQCPRCSRKFKLHCALEKHMHKVHAMRKEYKCSECLRAFGQREHLKRHVDSVHLKLRPFTCPHCRRSFSQNGNLNSHIRRLHNLEPERHLRQQLIQQQQQQRGCQKQLQQERQQQQAEATAARVSALAPAVSLETKYEAHQQRRQHHTLPSTEIIDVDQALDMLLAAALPRDNTTFFASTAKPNTPTHVDPIGRQLYNLFADSELAIDTKYLSPPPGKSPSSALST